MISGHVGLFCGDFWPRLVVVQRVLAVLCVVVVWWFLAVFGYWPVVSGRVRLLFGGFRPCLVIVW